MPLANKPIDETILRVSGFRRFRGSNGFAAQSATALEFPSL